MQLAREQLGLGEHAARELRIVERLCERGERAAAGHHGQRAPRPPAAERPVDDRRDHAGAAQRGLAHPGIARHHDHRLGAQPLDERADLEPAPEEHAAVRRLERAQAAIRVLIGRCQVAARRVQPLERLAQLLAAREPLLGIARQAAGDQRRDPRLGVERRRVALADRALEVGGVDPRERRRPADQLVHDRTQRVHVGAPGRRLSEPDLGRHVVGCARR